MPLKSAQPASAKTPRDELQLPKFLQPGSDYTDCPIHIKKKAAHNFKHICMQFSLLALFCYQPVKRKLQDLN